MSDPLACPVCTMNDVLEAADHYECATCGHEWPKSELAADGDGERVVLDANGNRLQDGDTVVLIKDLRLKGSSSTIKGGTKIKGIRLVEGDHEVDCKAGGMKVLLKACYLKKA